MRTVRFSDGHAIAWTLTDAPGADHVFTKLDGWWGAPTEVEKSRRIKDGMISGEVWRTHRQLTLGGFHRLRCHPDPASEAERIRRAIAGAFPSGTRGVGTVQVTDESGYVLEAVGVQLDGQPRFRVDGSDGPDLATWELPLASDDPYLYGPAQQTTAWAGNVGAGLEFPLFDDEEGVTTGVLEYGTITHPAAGTLVNGGNATAYPQVTVSGVFPSGFALLLTVDRDTHTTGYAGPVTPSSPVAVDYRGKVTVNGADQSRYLVERDWAGVPPGGTATIHLSATGAGTATMGLRSTYL